MTGNEFLRRLRRLGREQGLAIEVDEGRGKGSHARVRFGGGVTTIKDRRAEIAPGLLAAMCRQLGISRRDLDAG